MSYSMEKWAGKVAIVTGAAAGIGAAITRRLIEAKVKVVGLDRRQAELDALAQQLPNDQFYPIKTDTTQESEILNTLEWIKTNLGPVHILINNAGVYYQCSILSGPTDKFRDTLETNILGSTILTREVIKSMQTNRIDGHIIYLNSIFGHSIPMNFPNLNIYPATKHAIGAIVETLRQELNQIDSKIRVTSLSPGTVTTEMTSLAKNITEERRKLLSEMPSLDPNDIAEGVIFALSAPENVLVYELTIKPVGEKV